LKSDGIITALVDGETEIVDVDREGRILMGIEPTAEVTFDADEWRQLKDKLAETRTEARVEIPR